MIAAIQRGRFDGPNGAVQVPDGMSPPEAPGADPTISRHEVTPPPPPPNPAPAGRSSRADRSAAKAQAAQAARAEKADATGGAAARAPFPESDRSLDQMVLEYLVSEDMPEEVELALSPMPDFVSGRSIQTRLKAISGSSGCPLSDRKSTRLNSSH